jgi:hypothetical protein
LGDTRSCPDSITKCSERAGSPFTSPDLMPRWMSWLDCL